MPQLRQNIITGEWVVIAPERAKRPSDFIEAAEVKQDGNDPFATAGEVYKKNRIKDYQFESRHIYVIPNKFPAFVEEDKCSSRTYRVENDFYAMRPSTGGHDVIIVKDETESVFTFSQQIWYEFFKITKARYIYWLRDCNAQHSMLIYNQGPKSGASIIHPHGQLFAANIIPNQILKELNGAERYFIDTGENVFDAMIKHEKKEKVRLIEENEHFVAFTFYAARFPFETWVLPKNQHARYEEITDSLVISLAQIMRSVMKRFDRTLHSPPLNFYIHDLPKSISSTEYYRWHIEITPRLSNYGGYELGSGVIIDIMSPEEAAEYLRN